MKRTLTRLVAAGFLCTPLLACSSHDSTRTARDNYVQALTASMQGRARVGEIRLGAGDAAGIMLHDHYLAHFREQGQRDEVIVMHGQSEVADPAR